MEPGFGTFDFIACNLKRRPFRCACLAILVAALSFMSFGGSLIAYGLMKGADNMSKRLGADMMIVPSGYENAVSGILLRSEPSTLSIDGEWVEKIASVEGVSVASPQLLIATLSVSCCSAPVQIVGYDPETDFIVGPWVRTFFLGAVPTGEIIVGNAIDAEVGSTLKFFGREYRVAARLERTGMGFDACVFMDLGAARRAARDLIGKGGKVSFSAEAVSSIFLRISDGYAIDQVMKNIHRRWGYGGNGIAIVPTRLFVRNIAAGLNRLFSFFVALEAVIWILVVLVLGIVFSVTVNERSREFGIFRSLGATRTQIAWLVLSESGLVSLYGGLLGTFLSGLLVLPFRIYIGRVLNMPYVQASGAVILLIFGASFLLSFSVGPLAALASSVRAGKRDVCAVIRGGE
ncbi:MAG: ABC transporter permease [Synergistaceae bacterium]|jgi:putative ABC transport system permease protein|nr:ABC transporter permease [Synergistaceae bacterium]